MPVRVSPRSDDVRPGPPVAAAAVARGRVARASIRCAAADRRRSGSGSASPVELDEAARSVRPCRLAIAVSVSPRLDDDRRSAARATRPRTGPRPTMTAMPPIRSEEPGSLQWIGPPRCSAVRTARSPHARADARSDRRGVKVPTRGRQGYFGTVVWSGAVMWSGEGPGHDGESSSRNSLIYCVRSRVREHCAPSHTLGGSCWSSVPTRRTRGSTREPMPGGGTTGGSYFGCHQHEAAARSGRPLRASDPALESEDARVHLRRAQRDPHHRPGPDGQPPRRMPSSSCARPCAAARASSSSARRSRHRKRSPRRRSGPASTTSTPAGSAAC